MPRKRKAINKPPPKGDRIVPLPQDRRRWYQAALGAAANGLLSLLGIFRRRRKPIILKKPPVRRRKRK